MPKPEWDPAHVETAGKRQYLDFTMEKTLLHSQKNASWHAAKTTKKKEQKA